MWPMIWRLCRLLCGRWRARSGWFRPEFSANNRHQFTVCVAKGVQVGYGLRRLDSQTARDVIAPFWIVHPVNTGRSVCVPLTGVGIVGARVPVARRRITLA